MPLVRTLKRHPIVDAVLVHIGRCAHCRETLASDFSPCGCGHAHMSARGALTVFVPRKLHWPFKHYAPRWRAGRWEERYPFPHGRRATALFCALARCLRCGAQSISPESLRCVCGERHYQTQLPQGMHWILPYVQDDAPSSAAARKRKRRIPDEIRTMYGLQDGRCYYCGKVLGALDAPRPFVRDHLTSVGPYSRDDPASELNCFDNVALTCHACNEEKGRLHEDEYWQRLRKRRGAKWVKRRQRAMIAVRQWRKQYAEERRRRRQEAEMAHLDVIVEADYQARLTKRITREKRP